MARTDQRALPVVLFAVAAALILARLTLWPPDKPKGLVKWQSISAGLAHAKQTGKPILFDFTAEWCGPCRQLDAAVFADPSLAAEINERFVPIRVTDRQREDGRNPPDVEELQRKYNVRGFPTLVWAASNGSEELGRMQGFGGRETFVRIMERVP